MPTHRTGITRRNCTTRQRSRQGHRLRNEADVSCGLESTRYGLTASETTEGLVMRFRFSIASIMAAILIIALSFAALRINSVFCGGIILLTTLALLCSAIFMSFAESGPSRLAWIGCAVFGWPCFILGFGPVANERLGPPRTTAMFEDAIPYINPELGSEIKKYTPPGRLEVMGYSECDGNVARLCGRVAPIPPVEPFGADSGLRRDGGHPGILLCRQA